MNQEDIDFLSLRNPPSRLRTEEVALQLGFARQDIAVLVSEGLLKPLGHPPASGSKFFAAVEIQGLRTNTGWLAKASDAIVKHWRTKNSGRRNQGAKTS